jgi:hypothetical protein
MPEIAKRLGRLSMYALAGDITFAYRSFVNALVDKQGGCTLARASSEGVDQTSLLERR